MLNDYFVKDLGKHLIKYRKADKLAQLGQILIEVKMPLYNKYYAYDLHQQQMRG